MYIGVLALQGGFVEHIRMLRELNVNCIEIRQKSDLTTHHLDGVILPGGESSVIGKLLRDFDLFEPLKRMIECGLPVFGTCAGMILLANQTVNDHRIHFGVLDISVRRNAYGKQSGSFKTIDDFKGLGQIPMVFIRAPYIENVGENIEVLSVVNNNIVAVKQNNIIVTSFHPELTTDLSVHQYFISIIDNYKIKSLSTNILD